MANPQRNRQLRALFMGGIVPIIAFTLIEDHYGVIWGLVAGMVFGVGEILWEWATLKKVSPMTWGGNGMLLVLGGVSLFTQEGLWFKLQPAVMEVILAAVLWGSVLWKRPLLLVMAQKQGALPENLETGLRPGIGPILRQGLTGMTLRMGGFFAIQAGIAIWAALSWSTAAWAILKGAGLTVSLLLYMVVESLILRYRIASIHAAKYR